MTSQKPNAIWAALERPRDARRAHLHCWEDGAYRGVSWDEWRQAVERSAAGLHALGVRSGTRIAAVLTNSFDVCSTIVGSWLAGATLLSLPTLRRGMTVEEYVDQLRQLCRTTDAHVLLLEEKFIAMLDADSLGVRVVSFSSLGATSAKAPLAPLRDDEPAFVQYSSGSTSAPKGATLTLGAIARQEEMLAERLCVEEGSQGVMWLPLSHDMGLFGCVLLSWVAGMRLAISTPERFLKRPETWFDDAAEFGATITAAPNFGLSLATRKAKKKPPQGVAPLRTLVLGGERIEASTLDEAVRVLGSHGVSREALTPAYGLAEATLAVTMKRSGEVPRVKWVDRDDAYHGKLTRLDEGAPGATAVVSCGDPMPGVSVRIGAEGEIGSINLTSPSLAEGYIDDDLTTAAHFVDGEFQSGDIGFVHGGDLYVLGRTDDIVVVAGRNVYARDIEREVEAQSGVRPGCVALVDDRSEGQPRNVLLLEAEAEAGHLGSVAEVAARQAFKAAGVHIAECCFVEPGRLPKTPSGKIQRYRCRALLVEENGAVLERVQL